MYDPIKLMILIYLCADEQIPRKHLEKCRVNPNLAHDSYRTDLEFYVKPSLFRSRKCATILFSITTLNITICLMVLRKLAK